MTLHLYSIVSHHDESRDACEPEPSSGCSLSVAPELGAGSSGAAARLRIRCAACDGRGVYTLDHPNDPSARIERCEECSGTGNAVCVVCGDEAVGWDDDGWPRCGHHLPAGIVEGIAA